MVAIECKASKGPSLTRGNHNAIEDVKPLHTFVAAPVETGFPVKKGIDVVSVSELIERLKELLC